MQITPFNVTERGPIPGRPLVPLVVPALQPSTISLPEEIPLTSMLLMSGVMGRVDVTEVGKDWTFTKSRVSRSSSACNMICSF